ncbi:4'-phosphopantetheinyl transferase superfamily protein [Nonomuraea sp. FMUSA5-5]|uniref:4'-phosphopantetheinyl transferase superfamily protein n=1 Tax=Nonomuraea composti TaxID=2720023 RepID=A0ABX1B0Q0_9ACTN|nr:4'-phosphopantetheinyl transferase superfamily protein [Nonomuraea sp. FMUSA5-5]NJP88731.1 4'-phosphopantetheinyl transferase superfamily protein [Nonomuraea sp. FMUSA5-5]
MNAHEPGRCGVGWLARGEGHLPAGDGWLAPEEARRAAGMRFAKRRTEFLVARWTAKEAMGRLFPAPPYELEVRHHPSGAPEAYRAGAPLPVGVSLTDRAGWAVCLLGLEPGAVGCDLELVEPRSPAFVADYFTPAEREVIGADPLRANLLWSAKESALKVLRTGLRRDTRSVEVTLGCGPPSEGWTGLTVRAEEGRTFHGWWRRFGGFLLTVAADRPVPPPRALEEPPALAGAVPSHSWLAGPLA